MDGLSAIKQGEVHHVRIRELRLSRLSLKRDKKKLQLTQHSKFKAVVKLRQITAMAARRQTFTRALRRH